MGNVDFSPCAMAMLAAISYRRLTVDELRRLVPWNEPAMQTPDVCAWFDRLQELLDAGAVRRVPSGDGYAYRATRTGLVLTIAFSARPGWLRDQLRDPAA